MAGTSGRLLPEEFADLEPFAADWALPKANDRYQRRLNGTMAEMQAFYDAAVPRGEQVIEYLNGFELDELPDVALHLLWLMESLSVVSFAVDIFKQPKVPDSGAAYLKWVVEPAL
jgi:hypothetical protein